jgi:hypothetical protein
VDGVVDVGSGVMGMRVAEGIGLVAWMGRDLFRFDADPDHPFAALPVTAEARRGGFLVAIAPRWMGVRRESTLIPFVLEGGVLDLRLDAAEPIDPRVGTTVARTVDGRIVGTDGVVARDAPGHGPTHATMAAWVGGPISSGSYLSGSVQPPEYVLGQREGRQPVYALGSLPCGVEEPVPPDGGVRAPDAGASPMDAGMPVDPGPVCTWDGVSARPRLDCIGDSYEYLGTGCRMTWTRCSESATGIPWGSDVWTVECRNDADGTVCDCYDRGRLVNTTAAPADSCVPAPPGPIESPPEETYRAIHRAATGCLFCREPS